MVWKTANRGQSRKSGKGPTGHGGAGAAGAWQGGSGVSMETPRTAHRAAGRMPREDRAEDARRLLLWAVAGARRPGRPPTQDKG